MLTSILTIIGILSLIYVFWNLRKIKIERENIREELRIVYTIGLKEYNKQLAGKINQL
jgi:hypothetical protein